MMASIDDLNTNGRVIFRMRHRWRLISYYGICLAFSLVWFIWLVVRVSSADVNGSTLDLLICSIPILPPLFYTSLAHSFNSTWLELKPLQLRIYYSPFLWPGGKTLLTQEIWWLYVVEVFRDRSHWWPHSRFELWAKLRSGKSELLMPFLPTRSVAEAYQKDLERALKIPPNYSDVLSSSPDGVEEEKEVA